MSSPPLATPRFPRDQLTPRSAKKKKYPDGYPGDAPSSDTSVPVKYACHKCGQVFPARPHPQSEEGIALANRAAEPEHCVRCQHALCDDCPRAAPVKVDPAPDPDVLRRVEARLAALSVAGDAYA